MLSITIEQWRPLFRRNPKTWKKKKILVFFVWKRGFFYQLPWRFEWFVNHVLDEDFHNFEIRILIALMTILLRVFVPKFHREIERFSLFFSLLWNKMLDKVIEQHVQHLFYLHADIVELIFVQQKERELYVTMPNHLQVLIELILILLLALLKKQDLQLKNEEKKTLKPGPRNWQPRERTADQSVAVSCWGFWWWRMKSIHERSPRLRADLIAFDRPSRSIYWQFNKLKIFRIIGRLNIDEHSLSKTKKNKSISFVWCFFRRLTNWFD